MFQSDTLFEIAPTISVVIAAREAEAHVAECLESLLRQTRVPDQIIFYDDGSADGTVTVARRFLPILHGLEIIEGRTPLGIAAARNKANQGAFGDYIAVLDADDIFAPDAIEAYANRLTERNDIDLLYADTVVFTGSPEEGRSRTYPSFASPADAISQTLSLPIIPFKHSSMVYRRRAMMEAGGYDESLPIKIDVELFLRFHKSGRNVEKLDHQTSFHRKHHRQISTKRISGIRAYAGLISSYVPNRLKRGALIAYRIPSELAKMGVEYGMAFLQRQGNASTSAHSRTFLENSLLAFFRRFAVPLLLILVAFHQFFRVHAEGLSSWRGGGFGMYGSYHPTQNDLWWTELGTDESRRYNKKKGVATEDERRKDLRPFLTYVNKDAVGRYLESLTPEVRDSTQIQIHQLDFDPETKRLQRRPLVDIHPGNQP